MCKDNPNTTMVKSQGLAPLKVDMTYSMQGWHSFLGRFASTHFFEQIYEFEVGNQSIMLFSIELYQNNVLFFLPTYVNSYEIRQKDNNLDQNRKYFYRHFGMVQFFFSLQ